MLQRVYGTAWKSKEQLKAYEQFKAEAARRCHGISWSLSVSLCLTAPVMRASKGQQRERGRRRTCTQSQSRDSLLSVLTAAKLGVDCTWHVNAEKVARVSL